MEDQENQKRTLRAAIDRILPADNFPSASQADVDVYILALLKGDRRSDAVEFASGLAALDAEAHVACGGPFHGASLQVQDEILLRVERGEVRAHWPVSSRAFFEMILNLTAEGYFGDPRNGGNPNAVSWSMVGYEPGANRP